MDIQKLQIDDEIFDLFMNFEKQRIIHEEQSQGQKSIGAHAALTVHSGSAGKSKKWSEIAAVIIGSLGSDTLNRLIDKIDKYRNLIDEWKDAGVKSGGPINLEV